MAERRVEVRLGVRDRITREYRRIQRNIGRNNKQIRESMKRVKKDSGDTFRSMKRGISGVKLAFVALGAVATGVLVRSFIKAGSEVEDLSTQFEVLLGSAEAAKERMAELAKFAETTPFQLEQVARASRLLQVLTGGVLATGDSLRMVGDAAAAAGTDFAELAMWVGRAYSGLQANRPIGEALMRLTELGIVTAETRNEIERLQQAGRGTEAWGVLQKALSASEGGMLKLSKTVTGLTSTIRDQLNAAMRQILAAGIWDKFREKLGNIVELMNKALEDGTFTRWGDRIIHIGSTVLDVTRKIGSLTRAYVNFILEITGADEETKDVGKDYWNNIEIMEDLLKKAAKAQLLLTEKVEGYEKTMELGRSKEILAEQIKNITGVETTWIALVNKIPTWRERFEELSPMQLTPREMELEKVTQWATEMVKIHEGNAEKIAQIKEETEQKVLAIEKKYQKNSVVQTITAEDEKARKKREKVLEAARMLNEALILEDMKGKDKELEQLRRYYNEQQAVINEALKITMESETLSHEEITAKYQELRDSQLMIDKIFGDKRKEIQDKYREEEVQSEKEKNEKIINLEKAKIDSQLKIGRQLAGLAQVVFGEGRAIFLFQKSLAAAEVVVNTMRGIAAAMAEPFGVGLPRIPFIKATGAIALATIAAQTIKGFQKGGFVTEGALQGDRTLARVNRGEMILNASQQRNILALANGRGGRGGNTITFGDTIINARGGDPDAIASAVDQTMQERIRDLNEILKEKDALQVA